ncbi:hypothetical protein SESBI_00610 [Sesbania bispinosa]|nr:hypothetical protein SESBI_00610 [Sesbania bispinosa]
MNLKIVNVNLKYLNLSKSRSGHRSFQSINIEYDLVAVTAAAAAGFGGDLDIATVQSKSFVSTQGWDLDTVVDYKINEITSGVDHQISLTHRFSDSDSEEVLVASLTRSQND